MHKSDSIKELSAALVKAQASIGVAIKDSVNPHFKSKYADLGAVWAACRKPLNDNGLSVVQMPVDAGEPGRVALETILVHVSGEYISSTVSTRLMKDDAQGVGSAITYLRRYALAAFVGIVADEDDDGNAASAPAKPAAPRAVEPPPFDQGRAIKALEALPGATESDIKQARGITNRPAFETLYNAVKARA